MFGHGQLTDVNDKIFRARTIRSRDAVEFCTSLVQDRTNLYLVFGGIHPYSFDTAALFGIAVSFLFSMTTFILGVGKNWGIF